VTSIVQFEDLHAVLCEIRSAMESTLKEKFRKLHDTQATVVSTANYLIENSSKSKEIVKAWNQVTMIFRLLMRLAFV